MFALAVLIYVLGFIATLLISIYEYRSDLREDPSDGWLLIVYASVWPLFFPVLICYGFSLGASTIIQAIAKRMPE